MEVSFSPSLRNEYEHLGQGNKVVSNLTGEQKSSRRWKTYFLQTYLLFVPTSLMR